MADPEKAGRFGAAALVAGGFVAGAFTAYYVLWRAHALVAGHPMALRPSEISARPSPSPRPVPPATPAATPAAREETPAAAATPAARDGRP